MTKSRCTILTTLTVSLIIFSLFSALVFFSNSDYNQCERSCKMTVCENFSCFLNSITYQRYGLKCICNDQQKIPLKLPKADTISFDKNDKQYCVCDSQTKPNLQTNSESNQNLSDMQNNQTFNKNKSKLIVTNQSDCHTITSMQKPESFLHKGACGACSNANDYSVYVKTAQNLTQYSKKAAIYSIFSRQKATNMMNDLGFTSQCTQCWVDNMYNTFFHCLGTCISGSSESCKNGQLSSCLQCDEDYSGMYFRRCAGMTRRRAGIATDICRQDGEIVVK